MHKGYWLLFALLACLTGCVQVDSLNPFYSDRNVIFDPALLGQWGSGNPDEGGIRFNRAEDDAYQMVYTEKIPSGWLEKSVFSVHLVNLGGEKYLDVQPLQISGTSQMHLFRTDPSKKGSKFEPALESLGDGIYLEVFGPNPGKGTSQELQVKVHAAHWIYKINLNEKSLTLSFLDREWVKEQINKKLIQARHLKAKDDDNNASWVLSGSTEELQQFVAHHADDPGAFDTEMSFSKME
jgi:hypothetical protein